MRFTYFFAVVFLAASLSFVQAQTQGPERSENTQTPEQGKVYPTKKQKVFQDILLPVPKGFRPMSKGEKWLEYPSFKEPLALFTSENGEVDLGFNFSNNKWPEKDLFLLKEFYKSNLARYFLEVEYFQDTVRVINGKAFAVLEFKSSLQNKETDRPLPPIKNYSYLMYTVEDDYIVVFNFTCPAFRRPEWQATARKIMDNVSIRSDRLQVTDQQVVEALRTQYGNPRK